MFLKNWRSITLLNVDYKILAKVLANRVKPYLNKLVYPCQTGFIAGGNIANNKCKTIDIIDFVEQEKIPAVLVTLDFEKVFDRVERESLYETLRFFNFGEEFIAWSKVLYNNFQLCTINAGEISEWFYPIRGLQQGNPISSIYFILVVEILGQNIRQNEETEGIKIGGQEFKSAQFADDTNLFLKFKESVFAHTIQTVSEFEKKKNSRLKLNYDKSSVYRIGSLKISSAKLYTEKELNWTNETVTILEIKIHSDYKQIMLQNYQDMPKKVQNVLKPWKGRELSLLGKTMINTLVSSLFVHTMDVLPTINEDIAKELTKIIRNFLWKDKTVRINMQILNMPKDQGCLKVVNFTKKNQALNVGWIKVCDNNQEIRSLAEYDFGQEIGQLKWESNLRQKDIKNMFIKSF